MGVLCLAVILPKLLSSIAAAGKCHVSFVNRVHVYWYLRQSAIEDQMFVSPGLIDYFRLTQRSFTLTILNQS